MSETDELHSDIQTFTTFQQSFEVIFQSFNLDQNVNNNRCAIKLKNYFPKTNNPLKLKDDIHFTYVRKYIEGEWVWKRDVAVLGRRENLGKQGAIDLIAEISSGTAV
jgi:hypothetical protein